MEKTVRTVSAKRSGLDSYDNIPLLFLYIFVALIPIEYATRLPDGRTILFYLGLLIAALFLFKLCFTGFKIRIIKVPFLMLFLWLAWAGLSILWAENPRRSVIRVVDIFEGLIFVLIFVHFINSEKKLKPFIDIFYISTVLVSLYLILKGNIFSYDRVVLVAGENPNFFGRNIAIGFLIGSFYLIQSKKINKIFHLINILILLSIIIRLVSRGIYLGLAIAIISGFIFYFRDIFRRNKNFIFITAIILVGIFLTSNLITDWARRRVMRTFEISDYSIYGTRRLEVWSVAAKMYLDNPIIGVGVNNFYNRFPEYIYSIELETKLRDIDLEGKDSHNVFIGLLCELGIVGIIPFLIFLISIFKRIRKTKNNKFSLLVFMIYVFIFVSLFFNTIQYRKFFYFSNAIFLSTITIYQRRNEKK